MFDEFRRQFEAAQLLGIACLQCQLLTFFLGSGQRGLKHIRGRGAIAAFTLFVKINRCAMQAYQRCAGFQRTWRMTEIFGGDLLKAELFRRTAFPEESHFNALGE